MTKTCDIAQMVDHFPFECPFVLNHLSIRVLAYGEGAGINYSSQNEPWLLLLLLLFSSKNTKNPVYVKKCTVRLVKMSNMSMYKFKNYLSTTACKRGKMSVDFW